MRIPRFTRPGKEGINCGYRLQDQNVLDREFESNSPKVKVLISPLPEEEAEEQLCSLCGSTMQFLPKSHKFICTYFQCNNVVDVLNNTPLKKINQDMQPYQSQHYNPNNPEDGPVFISYSGDITSNKNYEITYDDGRIKHIRCRGYPKDISINAFND